MIAYFPIFYPDELIYSWICRYHTHIGYPDESRTFMDLFIPLEQKVSHDFSATFNDDVLDHLGMTDSFVREHTLIDYYTLFKSVEYKDECVSKLRSGRHTVGLYSPQYAKEYRMLRYCPRCASEDRIIYGETYYHRFHQIPDYNVCLKHRCKLLKTNVRIHFRQPVSLYSAEESIPLESIVLDGSQMEIEYAEYLVRLWKQGIFYSSNLHNQIRSYIPKEYLDDITSVINTIKLANDITETYSPLTTGNIPAHDIERYFMGYGADSRLICLLGFFFKIPFYIVKDFPDNIPIKGILPSEWKRM